MQYFKQLLIQRAWFGLIIIGISTAVVLKNLVQILLTENPDNVPLYLIGIFLLIFLMFFAFISVFMLMLIPYKRKLMDKKTIKETTLKIPTLYSFAENSDIDIEIPYPEDKGDGSMDDLIHKEKSDSISMLNMEKFSIKLFDEKKNELKTEIYTCLAGKYVISIRLENPSDLKHIYSIEIKNPRELEMSIKQISYNGK